jgi:Zn-dependent metalloprotease
MTPLRTKYVKEIAETTSRMMLADLLLLEGAGQTDQQEVQSRAADALMAALRPSNNFSDAREALLNAARQLVARLEQLREPQPQASQPAHADSTLN